MRFQADIVETIAAVLEAEGWTPVYRGAIPPTTEEVVLGVLSDRGEIDRPRVGTHRHKDTISLAYIRRTTAGDLESSYQATAAALRDLEDVVRAHYRWGLDPVYGSDLETWSINATPIGIGDGVLLEGFVDFKVETTRPREYEDIAVLYPARKLRLPFDEAALPLEDEEEGDDWTGDVELAGLGYGTFDGNSPGAVYPDTLTKHFEPIFPVATWLLLMLFKIDATQSGEGTLFDLHKPKFQGNATLYLRATPATLKVGMLGETPGAALEEIEITGLDLAGEWHVAGVRYNAFTDDRSRLGLSLDDLDIVWSNIFDGQFDPDGLFPTVEARIGAAQADVCFKGLIGDAVYWDSSERVPPEWGRKQSARWLIANAA